MGNDRRDGDCQLARAVTSLVSPGHYVCTEVKWKLDGKTTAGGQLCTGRLMQPSPRRGFCGVQDPNDRESEIGPGAAVPGLTLVPTAVTARYRALIGRRILRRWAMASSVGIFSATLVNGDHKCL